MLYPEDERFAALGAAADPVLRRNETYRTQIQMRHSSGELLWIDLSGRLVSTEPEESMWMNTMLDAAIETVTESDEKPIVHSDRGGHYRWPGWLARVADAKLTRSMSRKACSPDNAACEGFFGRLKTEMFYPGDWRSTTIEQFVAVLDKYIRWYNEKRIKSSLGYLSPIEYRESLGLTT